MYMNLWYYFDWFYEWGLHYATKNAYPSWTHGEECCLNFSFCFTFVFVFFLLCCLFHSFTEHTPSLGNSVYAIYTQTVEENTLYYLRNGEFMIELLVIENPRIKLSPDFFFYKNTFFGIYTNKIKCLRHEQSIEYFWYKLIFSSYDTRGRHNDSDWLKYEKQILLINHKTYPVETMKRRFIDDLRFDLKSYIYDIVNYSIQKDEI